MKLSVGQSLASAVDTTTLVVVRCPDGEVTVTCGGQVMSAQAAGAAAPAVPSASSGEGVQMGKRYAAEEFGLELLCVRGGEHPVAINGTPLAQKSAQPLPASD